MQPSSECTPISTPQQCPHLASVDEVKIVDEQVHLIIMVGDVVLVASRPVDEEVADLLSPWIGLSGMRTQQGNSR